MGTPFFRGAAAPAHDASLFGSLSRHKSYVLATCVTCDPYHVDGPGPARYDDS